MIEHQTLLDCRYRILGTLGSGGMAEVYLARDELLGREVALKALREQYAADEEFVERFAREARSAAALSHPNIASVYDLERSSDGRYYIVMEYISGGTLAEHLGRRGPLSAPTAAAVAEQIASGLVAAHAEGIIHRDVKPPNVLITAEGDAKLADFGIAWAAAATSVSRTGHILGTARYMSPEQAMGEQTTPRSDLYSLGGVLYEMLTGEVPFEADTPVAVSLKHVGERPHRPAELNPEVPEDMDAVVIRLLAKNPAERYESAGELAEDLERIQEGLPPVGASAVAPASASAVDGEVSSSALVSETGGGYGADEALPTATPGETKPRRRKLLLSVAPLAVVALFAAVLVGLSRGSDDGDVIGSLDGGLPGNSFGEVRGAVKDAEKALLGPQQVTIPEVEGLSEEKARQRLEERGFGAESRSRQSSEGDAGMVLEQSAPGGEQAEEGSVILLAIGDGFGAIGSTAVPDGAGGQASIPGGPAATGGPAGANAGGGGSGNGADGSSGPLEGPGNYVAPPGTDKNEAGSGSTNTAVGAPESAPPAQASSQTSPAPAPTEFWRAPASPSRSYIDPGGEVSGNDGIGDTPPVDSSAGYASSETPSETYSSSSGFNDDGGADGVPAPPQTPLPTQEIRDPVEEQYSSGGASQTIPAAP